MCFQAAVGRHAVVRLTDPAVTKAASTCENGSRLLLTAEAKGLSEQRPSSAQPPEREAAVDAICPEAHKRQRHPKKQPLDAATDAGGKPRQPPTMTAAAAAATMPAHDVLFGCPKCRYAKNGCGVCRANPSMARDKGLRWQPAAGRPQTVCTSQRTLHCSCSLFWACDDTPLSAALDHKRDPGAGCSPCHRFPTNRGGV